MDKVIVILNLIILILKLLQKGTIKTDKKPAEFAKELFNEMMKDEA